MILFPYIRVSTDDQENSLEMQLEAVKRYCLYHGYAMGQVFSDSDVSAYTELGKRPSGAKLLACIEKTLATGAPCGVVTLKLDRMFRNSIDAQLVARHWIEQDVPLYVIAMGGATFNTSTSIGWLIFQTLVNFAEFERNQISERTKAVKQHLKDNLKKNGIVPYGWQSDEHGNLSESYAEAQVVRIVFEKRYKEGLSYQAIADYLNDYGAATRNGSKMSPTTILRMLNYEPNIKLLQDGQIIIAAKTRAEA